MESVLEIATTPCNNTREAGAQLRELRAPGPDRRPTQGLAIGSAGTHPFAMWEDQRIVARPRYRELIAALRFVARQELIFGLHVHVASTTPTRRSTWPTACACTCRCSSRCRPTRRSGAPTRPGLLSTRTPIFRAFPRVGIPPPTSDWDDYEKRIEFMTTRA